MTITAYNEHPLRSSVTRILEMRGAPELSGEAVSGSETYSFARDKSFAIVQALHDLLELTPAELASTHALGQLHSNIQAPLNELTAFLANQNPGHISNAANQLEQSVLPLFWAFAPQSQRTAGQTMPAILQTLSTASVEAVRSLEKQRSDLAARLHELTSKASDLQKQLEAVTAGAAKERAEAAASVAKLDQSFAERETERQAKFEALLVELRKSFADHLETSNKSSDSLIHALEEQRQKAARIVQVVGNIGATGNYQRIANDEAKQANFWRWITIAIFGTGLSVAAATFYKFWGQPLTTETGLAVLVRLLYAIAITAPAWYTARESARHRTNADRARQTELELASIGPFIELMPEEKKIEIREKLTPLYFGRTVEVHAVNHPLDPSIIKDTAVEIAKAMKK